MIHIKILTIVGWIQLNNSFTRVNFKFSYDFKDFSEEKNYKKFVYAAFLCLEFILQHTYVFYSQSDFFLIYIWVLLTFC